MTLFSIFSNKTRPFRMDYSATVKMERKCNWRWKGHDLIKKKKMSKCKVGDHLIQYSMKSNYKSITWTLLSTLCHDVIAPNVHCRQRC